MDKMKTRSASHASINPCWQHLRGPFSSLYLSIVLLFYGTGTACAENCSETNNLAFHGTLTYEVIKSGHTVYHLDHNFSIHLISNGWTIKVIRLPGNNADMDSPVVRPHQGMVTNEAASDGAKLYVKNAFKPTMMVRRRVDANKSAFQSFDEVDFMGEPVPMFDDKFIFPVWLAYASKGYLRKHATEAIPPIMEMSPSYPNPTNVFYRYHFALNKGIYQFPSKIDFYRYLPNGTSYLKVAYKVESWKTQNEIEFPSMATFEIYLAGEIKGTNISKARFSLKCDKADTKAEPNSK